MTAPYTESIRCPIYHKDDVIVVFTKQQAIVVKRLLLDTCTVGEVRRHCLIAAKAIEVSQLKLDRPFANPSEE